MTIEFLKYLIARIMENAVEAATERRKDAKNDFKSGRSLAYYEVLDIIKSEADVEGLDLKELGLDIDLDKEL